MSTDIQQYLALARQLQSEREMLTKRLGEIDAALGQFKAPMIEAVAPKSTPIAKPVAAKPVAAKPVSKPTLKKVATTAAKPVQNKLTMREAVAQLVSKKALVISDIVEGMKRAGYVFKSSNPTNSVGAFLYGSEGKKSFKRVDGKFSMKK